MLDKKKTVLITGASRGIGAECARLFAENNYNVLINYNNSEQQARELQAEISSKGHSAIVYKADISIKSEVEKMFEIANQAFGLVDVLINNAGIVEHRLFTDIELKDWDRMFDINVKGTFLCSQVALKGMIANHKGKIINISSIWGMVGASCEVHYSASKAAVIGMTKALAKEVGPSNVQVNCIAPGVIQTDMIAGLDNNTIEALKEETPLGAIGKTLDIAELALFLASEKTNFITGQVISPNGGFVI